MALTTYSFLDTNAAIVGPGGAINLGAGAGAAEEGISYERSEEQDTMTIGADGTAMHSLRANKSGKVTVRLLKTSVTNAALQAMFNAQTVSGSLHGQNTITIFNTVTGDVITGQQCAFARLPSNTYAKEAGVIEWEFNAGQIDVTLGAGF